MSPSLRKPVCGEGPKVLDVVRDYGAPFAGRDLEDGRVDTSDEIDALGDSDNVISRLAEQHYYLRRELLVQEGLHTRSACSPAAAVALTLFVLGLIAFDLSIDLTAVFAVVGRGGFHQSGWDL